jgi:hypothetical protein
MATTFVVLATTPRFPEGLTPTAQQSARLPRPTIARQNFGRTMGKCRSSVPNLSRATLGIIVGLSEEKIADLERGHSRIDSIPFAALYAMTDAMNASLKTSPEGGENITVGGRTTIGAFIGKGGTFFFVKNSRKAS